MEKAAQRKTALAARRGLTAARRAAYSAEICRRLTALETVRTAEVILSYLAQPDEADLSAFHAWARAAGKTLAFPVTEAGGKMAAYAPEGPEDVIPGRYGIPEPAAGKSRLISPAALELVLAPCVAFDGFGGRLGRGGGYYDRYLPQCAGAARIAVAFSCQRVERVCTGAQDAPVDMTVTEAGIYAPPGECDRGEKPCRNRG